MFSGALIGNMKNKYQKGSSTIEILIAFVILIMATSAVILVVFGNQNLIIDTQTNSEALNRARTMLEEARAASRSDFSSVVSQTAMTEASGPLTYTKRLDVADIDSFTKAATSTVSWTIGARDFTVTLSTLLTDPSGALGGDTCSDTISGDWTAPQDWKGGFGYADIVSPSGASGVDAFNKKVYLTSNIDSTDNFYVIDVNNPKPAGLDLPILGKLRFDVGGTNSDGLTAVRVAGNYAYVAVGGTQTVHLLVIDVSDAANPVVVTQRDVTAAGVSGYGNTLAYSKKTLYLGLTISTGPELYIIDVADPLNPAIKGTFETGTSINQIAVKDDLAYLATPSSTQLWKVDVSDPTNPTLVQAYSPASTNWSGQSVAVSKDGTTVYFGRIYNIGANKEDLFAFNTSNLSSTIGSLTQDKQSGFTRMVVRGTLLFASNTKSNDGFQIWNVSNPATIVRYDTTPVNIQQASTAGMDCDGDYIYIGQRSNRALQIIGPS
ncbi:hypothetical protein FJY93_03925 [Candidatus Kaiserbacteria bacterium]|nr:hypothetical protein [Candidatus Kaiserbacteria bacterium]